MGKPGRVIRLSESIRAIPGPPGDHAIGLMRRGTLEVKLSLPVSPNRQTPHAQDEVYVVARGKGILVHEGRRDPFETGDLLFVPAGSEHHFEDFSDDLAVWVMFYGVKGGEAEVPD
jgi:mannose-6-phosphate isomerase-like protein (cupin superfamily)